MSVAPALRAPQPLKTPLRAVLAGASLAALLAAAPAAAAAASAPHYSLSIVEGETTLPEDNVQSLSASVRPEAVMQLSIVRAGQVVAQSTGREPSLSRVPEVGDLVTLDSPAGQPVASLVYDGLPSIDPTVCAGSTNFSGQRSAGQTVEGTYYNVAKP